MKSRDTRDIDAYYAFSQMVDVLMQLKLTKEPGYWRIKLASLRALGMPSHATDTASRAALARLNTICK